MLFNSVFTIFWDFNIQCRVCYTACSVNRHETVSLFKFPIKSLMIPFELNWPVSLIYIKYYPYTAYYTMIFLLVFVHCSLSTLVHDTDRYARATSASAGKRLLFVRQYTNCCSPLGICFSVLVVLVPNVFLRNYMFANDYNVVCMQANIWKNRQEKRQKNGQLVHP